VQAEVWLMSLYKGTFYKLGWPWSYGSLTYNYLCNQCLSPLMLWVRISIGARCTICDKVRKVGGFLRVLRFPPRYNWNIVERSVKHHQTNKKFGWNIHLWKVNLNGDDHKCQQINRLSSDSLNTKRDHDMWCWKSRSGLGTKMWPCGPRQN
jgi:hypothetical protein